MKKRENSNHICNSLRISLLRLKQQKGDYVDSMDD